MAGAGTAKNNMREGGGQGDVGVSLSKKPPDLGGGTRSQNPDWGGDPPNVTGGVGRWKGGGPVFFFFFPVLSHTGKKLPPQGSNGKKNQKKKKTKKKTPPRKKKNLSPGEREVFVGNVAVSPSWSHGEKLHGSWGFSWKKSWGPSFSRLFFPHGGKKLTCPRKKKKNVPGQKQNKKKKKKNGGGGGSWSPTRKKKNKKKNNKKKKKKNSRFPPRGKKKPSRPGGPKTSWGSPTGGKKKNFPSLRGVFFLNHLSGKVWKKKKKNPDFRLPKVDFSLKKKKKQKCTRTGQVSVLKKKGGIFF